jgi:hypothetical protein
VLARTVDADEDSIVDGDPLWVGLLTVEAKVVHVSFHFLVLLKISFLILQPILRQQG